MTPVDKIVLAREYDITGRWVLSAYTALCERPEPLALAEASQLGLETAMRIAQLREHLRAGGRNSSRIGGYHSLTRSAVMRQGPSTGSGSGRASVGTKLPRTERVQWGIGRSFMDQGGIPPPVRSSAQKPIARKGPTAIPGVARMVAEAFGIDLGAA